MKVLFLALGNELVASSRVRVYSYLPYLRREGISAHAINYTPYWQCRRILSGSKQGIAIKVISKVYSAAVLLALFAAAHFFDVVFIQKVALSKASISFLKALNKNIIFDFDDAIFFYQDITYMLDKAAGVIVSNKYLMDFAQRHNSRVYQLPSPVEVNRYYASKDNGSIVIGWIGSQRTSEYLEPLGPVFRALMDRFKNLTVELVGVERGTIFQAHPGVKKLRWSVDNCRMHFEKTHIGIMPLPDDDWARGKAGYKLLQYMSAGIPCVASPVGVNKEIIIDGLNGFLASTDEEWLDRLSLLVSDAPLRSRMGQEGLKYVEKSYSYKTATPMLISVLSGLSKRSPDAQ